MDIYYGSDQVVEEDQELQDFVRDVYVYGMRDKKASGRDTPLRRPQPSLPRLSLGNAGLWPPP